MKLTFPVFALSLLACMEAPARSGPGSMHGRMVEPLNSMLLRS